MHHDYDQRLHICTTLCPEQFATDHCDVAQQQLMLHVATEIESQFNRSGTSLTNLNSDVNDELWVNAKRNRPLRRAQSTHHMPYLYPRNCN